METYEMKQERRELMDRLCKEWNAKMYPPQKRLTDEEIMKNARYQVALAVAASSESNASDDGGGYTLFGIKY